MNDEGEIVGMVDVLKLTYATLEQVNPLGQDSLGIIMELTATLDQLDADCRQRGTRLE